jgi:hypothetical protein
MFHMSNSFFRSKMSNMDPSDIFRSNPQLAKQFAAAAAQQAGPGFGNFMGAAMGMPNAQQPAQNSVGSFFQAPNSAPLPPQMPQNMAAAPIPQGPRREMKGPSGIDDILKTFQEVRAADMDPLPPMFPQQPPPVSAYGGQPAMQAVSEISSIHSGDISDAESVRTTGTNGQRRGRRKPTVPVGNTVTLNL